MQNIFLPEKQMIMIPFNCNLMRQNLFFKVIYTRCVPRKLAQPNPSAFLWEKTLQLARDCFHFYKLYLFVAVKLEVCELVVFAYLLQHTFKVIQPPTKKILIYHITQLVWKFRFQSKWKKILKCHVNLKESLCEWYARRKTIFLTLL